MDAALNMIPSVIKILIVEDDLSLRPLWERFLSFQATEVVMEWAVSCEEAIKMIRQSNESKSPYFLIITDIFLAGSKTGMELLASREVLESKAKTVLVSAVDRNEIIEKFGHLITGTVILSKPIDFKNLESVFNKLLGDTMGRVSRAA